MFHLLEFSFITIYHNKKNLTSHLLYDIFTEDSLLKVNTVSSKFTGVNMPKNLISIKEIMEKYRLPYSTVNHYTIIGLLTVADRRKNIRLYDETEVGVRLRKITELRGKGYPLHLIRKELNK